MGKTIAILQSNYIPWKGYFDLINMVDEFILYDDMQYTRRDWRNRNKIKTANGVNWLTIPMKVKGEFFQPIKDAQVSDLGWAAEHWKIINHSYARAPFFKQYREQIESLYLTLDESYLSRINYRFMKSICGILGITTPITWSMDYTLAEGKTERLVDLCKQAGGSAYISGPAARDYIDPALFEQAGIALSYVDYSGYPEYNQLFPPFEHGVSILDLLFNTGPDAPQYMKSFGRAADEAQKEKTDR